MLVQVGWRRILLSSLTPTQKHFLGFPLVLSISLFSLYSIALQCPANSHYTDCLPSCPPSCLDLEGHCEGTSPKVPPTCNEGCLCHSGFVLSNDKCIPRIQCDCKDAQGALIPVSGLGEWECLLLLGFLFLFFLLLLSVWDALVYMAGLGM